MIDTARLHQVFMIARFGDPPVPDDYDMLCMSDRMEPVGNDKQRLAAAELGDRRLDVALIVGIHACGGFILIKPFA